MKILIIQQKMIGDVLTSIILLEALKKKFPDSTLHYLINTHTYPVVEHHPFVNEFIFFTPEIEKSYRKFYFFLKEIRQQKYDVVIDVYGKLSSNLITLFSGAKTKISYYKKGKAFLYTYTISRLKEPLHNASLAIENRMRLLEPLKVDFKNYSPEIHLQKKEIEAAKKTLEAFVIDHDKPIYMISLLGSGPEKTYPAQYMASLIDSIIAFIPEAQLLFNYIPKQLKEAQEIFNLTSEKTQKNIYFDLYGKSLREFLAITYHCNAVIGNEGGAINMAKALNIPTFIIFAPYLNKANWFGVSEAKDNTAVHLSDFVTYESNDIKKAKENPKSYYLKFKPTFIEPKLKVFLQNIQ